MSNQDQKKALQLFNSKRIALAIAIGLLVIGYLFYHEMSNNGLTWDTLYQNILKANPFWLIMAFIVLLIRDGGYIYRIRHLTLKKLNWKSSFYVIFLWEFASALTPSVVGGAAVAVFILTKEKIPFGKSLAYVMLTTILDNLFFVLGGLLVLLYSGNSIFPETAFLSKEFLENSFYISYGIIAFYICLMAFGLFISPRGFKYLLIKITSFKFLRRWRIAANEQGTQMITAAKELKKASFAYWTKASISTIFIWIARYFMLNCLVAAFASDSMSFNDHHIALSRQVIMWIAQLVSPTPGAAGVAEKLFTVFFRDILTGAGMTLFVAFLWRAVTHIAYLAMGAFILPRWIKRVF